MTRCIFHLTMVLTENSSCVVVCFSTVILALYLQLWSHIAVCVDNDIFRGLIFSVICFCLFHPDWHTTVSHYIVHLFGVSGFRQNKTKSKEVCCLSTVQVHRRNVDHSHLFMVLCWRWQRYTPIAYVYFHLQSSFESEKKFTYNWIPKTHENINNLLKLIANVS